MLEPKPKIRPSSKPTKVKKDPKGKDEAHLNKTLDDGRKVYWNKQQRHAIDFDLRKWRNDDFNALIATFDNKSGTKWMEEDGTMHKSYKPDGLDSIRVQVNMFPNDTKISVPGYKDKPFDMSKLRKTMVYKKNNDDEWQYAFYRGDARMNFEFDRVDDVQYCIIVLQEPRYWIDYDTEIETSVAFKAVPEEIEYYSIGDPICYDRGRAMTQNQYDRFAEK